MSDINNLILVEDINLKNILDKYDSFDNIVSNIHNIILEYSKYLNKDDYIINNDVYIHKSVKLHNSSVIMGPAIIMENCEIRVNAFVRGNALILPECVIGNSSEIKNAILFRHVQVPHFNYVGDSILGNYSHLGAGAIISNVKSDNSNVVIHYKDKLINSNLRKFGCILADHVEIGCNSVICPGSVIDKNTNIYPLTMVRGYIKPNMIVKDMERMVLKNE